MKRRQIILAGAVAAGAVYAWLLGVAGGNEPKVVEQTRRSLRREAFQTDLPDFDFSASPELRQLPGATNRVFFASKYPSAMQCIYNTKQMTLASFTYQVGDNSYLGRVAEAEVRRRLAGGEIGLRVAIPGWFRRKQTWSGRVPVRRRKRRE